MCRSISTDPIVPTRLMPLGETLLLQPILLDAQQTDVHDENFLKILLLGLSVTFVLLSIAILSIGTLPTIQCYLLRIVAGLLMLLILWIIRSTFMERH